ncbi:hypothetical protein SteCoe_25290 [Stentor coeruleus]|uniref:Uncharacterized protein n=1 Tax=Stentor coeruleus TaxID=5963 RepID=A0A1R2BFK2_9CILI|nr:hypothetical protein SteCoe_25290 [Stentor coeruleus]
MSIKNLKMAERPSDYGLKVTDDEETAGIDPSYEGPTRACQDDFNTFPSISESQEEHTSETLKSEDVQVIMEKNQQISCQVELRLEQFLMKTQELSSFPMSKLPSQNVSFEIKQSPKMNGIDALTIQNLKIQQDYLMKLFDQVSVLQTEVEMNMSISRKNETTGQEIKKNSCMDKCGYGNTCSCRVI